MPKKFKYPVPLKIDDRDIFFKSIKAAKAAIVKLRKNEPSGCALREDEIKFLAKIGCNCGSDLVCGLLITKAVTEEAVRQGTSRWRVAEKAQSFNPRSPRYFTHATENLARLIIANAVEACAAISAAYICAEKARNTAQYKARRAIRDAAIDKKITEQFAASFPKEDQGETAKAARNKLKDIARIGGIAYIQTFGPMQGARKEPLSEKIISGEKTRLLKRGKSIPPEPSP